MRNFHITLAFLGDIDHSQLLSLEESFDNYQPRVQTIQLDDVGYWPDSGILWLGPRKLPDSLAALAKRCNRAANNAGIRVRKRKYQPHLTLARSVSTPPAAPLEAASFEFSTNELVLQQSLRDRDGVRYTDVRVW